MQHNRHIPPAYHWLHAADSIKINIYAHHYACYRQKVHKKLYEKPMTPTCLQVSMEPPT